MNYNQPLPGMYGYGYMPQQGGYQQNQMSTPLYQAQPYQQQFPQYQQAQSLSGKYVDSIDVVKATEVPIGGSGIFPKADMSEIYVKAWNADGTTKVMTFKPVTEPTAAISSANDNDAAAIMQEVMNQLKTVSVKIDKLSADLGG